MRCQHEEIHEGGFSVVHGTQEADVTWQHGEKCYADMRAPMSFPISGLEATARTKLGLSIMAARKLKSKVVSGIFFSKRSYFRLRARHPDVTP